MEWRLKNDEKEKGDSGEIIKDMQYQYHSSLAKAALNLSKVMKITEKDISDEIALNEYQYTLEDKNVNKTSWIDSSVTLNPHKTKPFTIELNTEESEGKIYFSIAVMKQREITGVKMFFNAAIDKYGSLYIGDDMGNHFTLLEVCGRDYSHV